ncbi:MULTISPECIES: hypothetical protein [unclassified Methylobacterium]|uniref:hypothetical protein n=1 Tax=unclassified Methylobacterium TaxID=2615210 RepID=UPI002ACDC88B|nr:hypothetical protein [Methylobacterium sp. 4-46]
MSHVDELYARVSVAGGSIVEVIRSVNPLTRKLANGSRFSAQDGPVLGHLASLRQRDYAPGVDIVRDGEPPNVLRLELSGWACRYMMLEDGRRATVAFVLPGTSAI